MKQGGRDLTTEELHAMIEKIEGGKNGVGLFSSGLQGIDAENTGALFDDALEALVQQYGLWALNYDVDKEYNRKDLREEALRRALWAILVLQGYVPYGDSGYGDWKGISDDDLSARSFKRSEAWEVLNDES